MFAFGYITLMSWARCVNLDTDGCDTIKCCGFTFSLAKHGRLLVLGFISGYDSASGIPDLPTVGLPARVRLTLSTIVIRDLSAHYVLQCQNM